MYLNCHTQYSLHYGLLSEKELLTRAAETGVTQLAVTDINNTSAILNILRMAEQFDIHIVPGIDFRVEGYCRFVGLAHNNRGFQNLNLLLTENMPNIPHRCPAIEDAFIIYPLNTAPPPQELKAYEFTGIRLDQLSMLPFSRYPSEKLVLLQPSTFLTRRQYDSHCLLRAIEYNTLLAHLHKYSQAEPGDLFYPPQFINQKCAASPFLYRNASRLLKECKVYFDFSPGRPSLNQKKYNATVQQDHVMIDQLVREGMRYRYGSQANKKVWDRVDREMEMIKNLGFIAYFLINWDIIHYARSCDYPHVGRGSGANSIVAYLLGITEVDPLELDLYFERFINAYRTTPPDFDIDFSWTDRDDVTRYIFERFPNTALLATYNTFQYRAVIREVSKVFGLPEYTIKKLTSGRCDSQRLDETEQKILHHAHTLHGLPHHLSVHSSGILISDPPIAYFSSTFIPPKGFPTVQFDMITAEDVGLYKFDILGQRGLAKIRDTVEIIKYNQNKSLPYALADIKGIKQDEKIRELISSANCLGCFYIESPAMRMLLSKLKVKDYLTLVAASSIIRPGVARSGMMREYIYRHRHPDSIPERAHSAMLEIMPDTYGIMVYQEDVIKVAHQFAGLSLAESDVLRRGMSGKYRSREEFQKVKNNFLRLAREKGHPTKLIKEVWHQIESFAGYSFAKGHSASYAVESYQSLMLMAYFPLEYMVAVLNNGGGFYTTETYVHEARRKGGQIEAPCINRSYYLTVIYGKIIYLGLHYLKSLKKKVIERLIKARRHEGPFLSLENFLSRVKISKEQSIILIRASAFRFTGLSKKKLLWQLHYYMDARATTAPAGPSFFPPDTTVYELPDLKDLWLENVYDEIELLGFPLHDPFDLAAEPITINHTAAHFSKLENRIIDIFGYLVAVKNTSTVHGDRMQFATFRDRDGIHFDTTHFPQVVKNYRFKGTGLYKVRGKVSKEFDTYSIEVHKMRMVQMKTDPRDPMSR